MKLKWQRVDKDTWKSQIVAGRRYEIGRWEERGPGGRPTGTVRICVVRFARARRSGKWYPRFFHGDQPRTLKEAKAIAQADASASGDRRGWNDPKASAPSAPLRMLPLFFPV